MPETPTRVFKKSIPLEDIAEFIRWEPPFLGREIRGEYQESRPLLAAAYVSHYRIGQVLTETELFTLEASLKQSGLHVCRGKPGNHYIYYNPNNKTLSTYMVMAISNSLPRQYRQDEAIKLDGWLRKRELPHLKETSPATQAISLVMQDRGTDARPLVQALLSKGYAEIQ